MIILFKAKIVARDQLLELESNDYASEYLAWCRVMEASPLVEMYTVQKVDYPTMTPVLVDMFEPDYDIREKAKLRKWIKVGDENPLVKA